MLLWFLWSEWGDSNSRHLEPKGGRKLFSNLLYSVSRYLFRNPVLFGTVFSVVSRCSNPVYGQICGQIQTLPERHRLSGSVFSFWGVVIVPWDEGIVKSFLRPELISYKQRIGLFIQ